jgi:hypothetical protein
MARSSILSIAWLRNKSGRQPTVLCATKQPHPHPNPPLEGEGFAHHSLPDEDRGEFFSAYSASPREQKGGLETRTYTYKAVDSRLRVCSQSSEQNSQEGQVDELQAGIELALAVFP